MEVRKSTKEAYHKGQVPSDIQGLTKTAGFSSADKIYTAGPYPDSVITDDIILAFSLLQAGYGSRLQV
jgi:hypothetical protein